MEIFYSPDIAASAALPEEESRHCIKVLRKRSGDEIIVVDGRGTFYTCRISSENAKSTAVEIIGSHSEKPRPFKLRLGCALTKNIDRFEWLVEKSMELGVDEIYPLVTGNSERVRYNEERMMRLLVSAMKQSQKASLPLLHPVTSFSDLIARATRGNKIIAHCHSSDRRRHLQELLTEGEDLMVTIGPEGDFTPDEVEAAVANGFSEAWISESRLRTETAAMMTVAVANYVNRV